MTDSAEERFRAFVAAQAGPLMRTAYLLTGDRGHAEDLVQQALCTTYLHWRTVMRYDRPEAYARKVMLNERRSVWRRRRPEYLTAEPPERGAPDSTAGVGVRDELWTQLRRLAPRTRAVIVLRYWEDRSQEETAQILDCSVGTVKKLSAYGLARLRQYLEPPGGMGGRGVGNGGSTGDGEHTGDGQHGERLGGREHDQGGEVLSSRDSSNHDRLVGRRAQGVER